MPVIEIKQNNVLDNLGEYDRETLNDPGMGSVLKSGLVDNLAYQAGININLATHPFEHDKNYDVYSDLKGYEQYASRFIGVENELEAATIKQKIDLENDARRTMGSASGLESIAAFGVGVGLDPMTYIPVGGTAYKTYRTGGRILEGAAKTAAVGLAAGVAQEAGLQALQEARPINESYANIAATTFLSGIIGGAAGAFGSRAELDALAKRVDDELTVPYAGESSVGAKAVKTTSFEQEQLKGAFGLEKALSFQDPVLRLLNSPSKETMRMSEKLAETYLLKNKHDDFIPSEISVENMIKSYNLPKYTFFKNLDDSFLKYRQREGALAKTVVRLSDAKDAVAAKFGKARPDGKMTYHEFSEAVVKAARRNDTHDIPEVAQAATALRRDVFDPIFKRGQEAGIFGEDIPQVSTAPSYVTRLWHKGKIEADMPRFKDINKKWLLKKRDDAVAAYEKLQAEIDALKARELNIADDMTQKLAALKLKADVSDWEIDDIANELTNRILGTPAGRLPYDFKMRSEGGTVSPNKAQLRGAARQRVYDIPDELVEDFLVNDVETIVESYTRSLASDIELTKKFGSVDETAALKRIEEDYAKLTHQAQRELSAQYSGEELSQKLAKSARDLKKQMDHDIRDFQAIWQRLRGTYAVPEKYNSKLHSAERTALNFNYVRLLGGMTISAFTDVARPVMAHGLGNVYKEGIRSVVKNWKGFRAAAEDVKEAGTALDMVLDTRARAQAGTDEIVEFSNRIEAGTSNMARNFGVLALMSPWNAAMKQFSGVITQGRMIKAMRELSSGKQISQKEITNLAANFIDEDMAKRIADQFKKHGEESDVIIPNVRDWDDHEAALVFRAAVRREVDAIIVTPGQDKPLWMSRSGLKLLGQFRSFAFSSTQKTMLSALQKRDMDAMNGAALSLFLGMGVYALKEINAGRKLSDDPRIWISEGIDRSGLTAWFFDANNIVEKVSRGRIGVNALVGGPPMSRYASRSALEAIFGPTYGAMGDITNVTGSAFAGEWRASDTAAIRKLMPYQNLFYMRSIFDEAEENINSVFGVKGATKK